MDKKIILLVEDNPDDVELTLRALKKTNVFKEVVVVRDGAEALDFLFGTGDYVGRDMRICPELILLDFKLPKINGLDVLKQMRRDKRTRLLPVIILTSSDEEEDIIESYEPGVNSYIRKPVDFDRFSDVVLNLGMYWLVLNTMCLKS